jgi:glutamate 5-kinase
MTEDWAFAPPAFDAQEALASLKRSLRELGLVEREGRFERKTIAIARAAVEGEAIAAARVKRPSRSSPEWQQCRVTNSGQVRDFVADLKKQLAQWSDLDD